MCIIKHRSVPHPRWIFRNSQTIFTDNSEQQQACFLGIGGQVFCVSRSPVNWSFLAIFHKGKDWIGEKCGRYLKIGEGFIPVGHCHVMMYSPHSCTLTWHTLYTPTGQTAVVTFCWWHLFADRSIYHLTGAFRNLPMVVSFSYPNMKQGWGLGRWLIQWSAHYTSIRSWAWLLKTT